MKTEINFTCSYLNRNKFYLFILLVQMKTEINFICSYENRNPFYLFKWKQNSILMFIWKQKSILIVHMKAEIVFTSSYENRNRFYFFILNANTFCICSSIYIKSIKIGLLPQNFSKILYENKRHFSKLSNINLISILNRI